VHPLISAREFEVKPMFAAKAMMLFLFLTSGIASATLLPIGLHLPVTLPRPDDCGHDTSEFRCVEYMYNYDGDTITVHIPNVHPLIGEKISVRISGVDAPELVSSDPCERSVARASRNFVRGLLADANRIDLRNLKRDKYFRILADVFADGVSVSEMLLFHGYAYPYDGGRKQQFDWCEKVQP
jgi:micrococcal nuclease